ncbi:DNA alkylation repair protein [Marinigracilibium pacificum]|uniref:DNA alkylation repair protein n=1 Tax=Marinigracilibium pacificum TaxID=2729599 RepID=A0A848IXZ6_9BACT|nr:DNA alkylation repair protein [Marinigracilibium pacificum]NMM49167.1 DNA alkylation repair protein [Marinigracilibium pacificum]
MSLELQKLKILEKLKSLGTEDDRKGLEKFGIPSDKAYGVRKPKLRAFAKELKIKNNELADLIWQSGILEAKILASLIANPKTISKEVINNWVHDMDNWDVCDQLCGNLVDKTQYVNEFIFEWAESDKTYVRRAAFSSIAWVAVHNKKLPDSHFKSYYDIIEKGSTNEKEKIVLKAIDWAARQIGKRNASLNKEIQMLAKRLIESDTGKSKSIGNIVLKEITSEKILKRLND